MSINEWHLDRRVPMTLLFMILLQTGGLFYFGGKLEGRVSSVEERQLAIEKRQEIAERQAILMARLDERTGFMSEDIKELKKTIKGQNR